MTTINPLSLSKATAAEITVTPPNNENINAIRALAADLLAQIETIHSETVKKPVRFLVQDAGADPTLRDFPSTPPVLDFPSLGFELDCCDEDGFTLLTRAVSQNNIPMVYSLKTIGANLDQSDEEDTPLTLAVRQDNFPMVLCLNVFGASLNHSDANGHIPLTLAVIMKNFPMVRYLTALGASLSHCEDEGYTPLTLAVFINDPSMIQGLKNLGADLNQCDERGWTPWAFAKSQEPQPLTKLLTSYTGNGLDIGLNTQCYYQKVLAATWGLDGTVSLGKQSQNLEGGSHSGIFGCTLMKNALTAFFLENPTAMIEKNRTPLLEAFNHVFIEENANENQILQRMSQKKPVCLIGGTETHTIGILLINEFIGICNRAERSGEKPGVNFYRLIKPLTKARIRNLTDTHSDSQSFYRMLGKLIEPRLVLYLPQKAQKSENCYFTSPKSLVYALAHVIDPSSAKKFYKQLSAFIRKNTLEQYFEHIPREQRSRDLLSKIGKKLSSKIDRKQPNYDASLLSYFVSNNPKIS